MTTILDHQHYLIEMKPGLLRLRLKPRNEEDHANQVVPTNAALEAAENIECVLAKAKITRQNSVLCAKKGLTLSTLQGKLIAYFHLMAWGGCQLTVRQFGIEHDAHKTAWLINPFTFEARLLASAIAEYTKKQNKAPENP